jgi:hypothetical protein
MHPLNYQIGQTIPDSHVAKIVALAKDLQMYDGTPYYHVGTGKRERLVQTEITFVSAHEHYRREGRLLMVYKAARTDGGKEKCYTEVWDLGFSNEYRWLAWYWTPIEQDPLTGAYLVGDIRSRWLPETIYWKDFDSFIIPYGPNQRYGRGESWSGRLERELDAKTHKAELAKRLGWNKA